MKKRLKYHFSFDRSRTVEKIFYKFTLFIVNKHDRELASVNNKHGA